MMIVRVLKSSGPSGNSPPPCENKYLSNVAIPMPPKSPMIEAMMPMISASIRTIRVSCCPVAPMDRRSPNCRMRWLIRIANVL